MNIIALSAATKGNSLGADILRLSIVDAHENVLFDKPFEGRDKEDIQNIMDSAYMIVGGNMTQALCSLLDKGIRFADREKWFDISLAGYPWECDEQNPLEDAKNIMISFKKNQGLE